MGWETRGGRQYYYRKQRVGGAVRSIYTPELSAGLVEALTAHNRAASVELRRAIAAERAEAARVADVCRGLVGAVRELLLAAGFHEHKRQWRRRRMPNESSETAAVPSGAVNDDATLLAEAMFSKKPSEEAKALVAELLGGAGFWRHQGDFMGEALKETVDAASDSYLTAESLKHGLEEMKAELGFETSSLPERLLIEQVLLCWLRLSLLEREQARALSVQQPYAYLNHLQTATTQAQRRYTNAISSLARVRRLLRPREPLFQVNVLSVAGDGPKQAAAITVEAEEPRRLGG
jgi:hypothetical protein